MIFIGDVTQVLISADCKNVSEFARKTKYHKNYIAEIFKGRKCSGYAAAIIANCASLEVQDLFKENPDE